MWHYKCVRRLQEASRVLHPSKLVLVVGKSAEIVITDRSQFTAVEIAQKEIMTGRKVFWNMENYLIELTKSFRKFCCPSQMVIKKHGMT